jgi:hypothetical protein
MLRGTQSSCRDHLADEMLQTWLFDGTIPSVERLDFGQVRLYTDYFMS